jgi:hypothetical protein
MSSYAACRRSQAAVLAALPAELRAGVSASLYDIQ